MQTATFTRSHQCGSSSRFHKFMYSCEIFVFSRTYLFVRALLAITRSTPTQEGRPEPMVEVWARSEHCSSSGVRSKFFFRWEWIRRFPGLQYKAFLYFHRAYVRFFYFADTYDPETSTAAAAAAAVTEHATTNWLRYNPTAPGSSRQHHARVTDPRCTVSSCFGKHMRSVTHHIYSLPIISRRLFLFCFVRHKTQTPPQTTAAVNRARYKQHAHRAQQQQAMPCACDRYALYRHARCTLSSCFVEPEVRHPSHTFNSLLELCSAAEATSCMYVAAHPCTWLPSQRRCSDSSTTTAV